MILNAVTVFGHESGGNGPAALAFLIIFMLGLLGAIVALAIVVVDQFFLKKRKPEETEKIIIVTDGNTTVETVETVAEEAAVEEVAVVAAPVNADDSESDIAEEVPEEDLENYRAGRLTYDKSFLAKYIQSDDTVKEWYARIKNELMAYERVHDRLSWRRETFKVGKHIVARIGIRGRTLCIYLPLDPKNYENTDYRVEDASDVSAYVDTPCVYRVRSDQRLEYAFELIEDAMHSVGAEKGVGVEQDYYLPYQNLSQLIDRKLVKRVMRN